MSRQVSPRCSPSDSARRIVTVAGPAVLQLPVCTTSRRQNSDQADWRARDYGTMDTWRDVTALIASRRIGGPSAKYIGDDAAGRLSVPRDGLGRTRSHRLRRGCSLPDI